MPRDEGCLLITGASSGLGSEMARRFSASHRLILAGRDEARLQRTRSTCHAPERQLIWRHDLMDVEGIAGQLGDFLAINDVRVAGLVHSAAHLSVLPLRSLTPDMVLDTFRANVFAAMELVRTLTKKRVNQQRLGAVVFVSSIASQFGAKGFSAYSASKGALDALMKSLAVELAPGVRVNSVLPGALRTAMTESMFDDPGMADRLAADYPLGIGVPADIVDAVEFLLSEKARWITGQQLVVDGGRTTNITA
ncbi:SDR family oxidoreductase [Rhodanobacter sp. 7MK24]|uniref:SDR family NAD(P)-dependent oxidoreductase n=1 Tax=Rhodanobacter sp. 7MK24 TaxID=2775922 RepID=UPI00178161BC|nr:SDR family oxidoreductase [Rhodanobacter sp. 7MK24]MBD8881904.1 SDR family oxidoreductase [Rhodanobacter sp. 7MK24]